MGGRRLCFRKLCGILREMIRLFFISLLLVSMSLNGCMRETDVHEPLVPPSEYLELLQAYDEGRIFSHAGLTAGKCVVTFSDGSAVTVPETAFEIHDCTEEEPIRFWVSSGWWCKEGLVLGIKADSSLSNEDAFPLYVYFDKMTLYMKLSNYELLEFRSVALEEEEKKEEELEKMQNIPEVRIVTDGHAPIRDKKNYVKGSITISDPKGLYGEAGSHVARMGIRGRGNSTWGWPKKPWKVKLEEKAEILGMPADKEWALLANYSDRTLMRNLVAMRISEICGFSWTPRMRSVEVYLNNEYQGVYTFCEHKKVSPDRVDIDLAEENDAPEAGGYYLEMEENQDETTCWWTKMGVPMMFSEPEVPTSDQLAYVKGMFEAFENALYSDYLADPETGYAKYIDVDSFINYYIIQELTKNIDGNLRKSSFITIEPGGKMEMYHVWDFDLTLGNCGYFDSSVGNGPENFWIKDFTSGCWRGDNWYNRMMTDPVFVSKLQARWNELMPELEAVSQFIDDQALMLDKAQERNFRKWNINESVDWVNFPSLGSYEKEVEYLRHFYSERLKWLDREINRL